MTECVQVAKSERASTRGYEYTVYVLDSGRVELTFENEDVTVATVLPWSTLRDLVKGLTEAAEMCGATI